MLALSANMEKQLPGFYLKTQLELFQNELVVILGPSGSGKSLTLQLIAGLIIPDSGEITFKEEVFFDHQKKINLKPQQRKVGYVFQDYSLFPHMTVTENIAYGIAKKDRGNQKEIVSDLINTLRLKGHENKYPHQLSGGQQQRVAIGRALSAKPRLLLLDEPFSALDNIIRHKVRMDLLKIKEDYGLPMLMVTHDLEEAYTLGTRLLVMNKGKVLQTGTPQEVFISPVSRQVAKFVGMRNIFQGKIISHQLQQQITVIQWKDKMLMTKYIAREVDSLVSVGIRPEEVMLIREERALGESVKENLLKCTIIKIVPEGLHYRLFLRFSSDSYDFEMLLPRHVFYKKTLNVGDQVTVSLKMNSLKYLE